MPILNYTTTIDPAKTVLQIHDILVKGGAASVRVDYEGGEPVALMFLIRIGNENIPFRLPSNWEGVWSIIKTDWDIPKRFRTPDQAKRIAWRVLKDWVEAQLAYIASGQASIAQLFLPHAVGRSGRTLFEEVVVNPAMLLGSGSGEERTP